MWAEGRTFILRSAIFVGLASVVTTIIYFTPIPDQAYISSRCERPCHELEMPMICRLKLYLEAYETMTGSCGDCPRNSSDCFRQDCIIGDGVRRPLVTVNRQLPAQSIQVCENDILVVDVINQLPGREVTFHWRGQPQKETPFMDGVAMVTQCPIPSGTTFQYKFRASRAGTHLWHAHHTGGEVDNMFGALVVRQAESKIRERSLYDLDERDHVIVVSAFSRGSLGQEGALLINGRTHIQRDGAEYSPTSFLVTQGRSYRFRLVNAGGSHGCAVSVSVDSHQLTVIALDGNLVVPETVDSIVLSEGERADFVLQADQRNASYRIHASPVSSCEDSPTPSVAVLRYSGTEAAPPEVADVARTSVRLRGDFKGCDQEEQELCVSELRSSRTLPVQLRGTKLDSTLYLAFGYRSADGDRSQSVWTKDGLIPHINNITYRTPSSPLLTQNEMYFDLCSQESMPGRCIGAGYCECVHVIDIPLGRSVELVLSDEAGVLAEHVFHLHGHSFHVVGTAVLDKQLSSSEVQNMDDEGKLLSRNLENPVVKDTIAIPPSGVAALRFTADNPGYWLLEAHRGGSRMSGMSVVLHVGLEGDTPPTPDNFPQCSSWVGPDFFLI